MVPTLEDGKITFANDSRSTITHSLLLNVTAKYEEIKFTFQAKFFICPCSEDLILGRSTLNATGLIHLYITEDVAPNPFKPTASVSNVVIEIVDDQSGELDDAVVPHPEPAFQDSTPNLWIPYCSSLGIPYEIFFDLIDWFARHSTVPLHKLLKAPHEFINCLPKGYKRPSVDLKIVRKSHKNAPLLNSSSTHSNYTVLGLVPVI